nr:MAG TPA: hypothetical protein [Caudoviricetes sp.]
MEYLLVITYHNSLPTYILHILITGLKKRNV